MVVSCALRQLRYGCPDSAANRYAIQEPNNHADNVVSVRHAHQRPDAHTHYASVRAAYLWQPYLGTNDLPY